MTGVRTVMPGKLVSAVAIGSGAITIIAGVFGAYVWLSGLAKQKVLDTVFAAFTENDSPSKPMVAAVFSSPTFLEKLQEAIKTDINVQKETKALTLAALESHVKDPEFMKEEKSKLHNVWSNVNNYFEKIDSGYTYGFSVSNDGFLQKHEFRFFADPEMQTVYCYIIGKEHNIEVGRDIDIILDGAPLTINDRPYEGKIEGANITAGLQTSFYDTNIHKIVIKESEKTGGLATKRGEATSYPAHLLILVKNSLARP